MQAEVERVLDVSEVVLPERPWHSVIISYSGHIAGGKLRAEPDHPYGDKTPRWFPAETLASLPYHPPKAVEQALGLKSD